MDPIDFGDQRSKVKVTIDIYGNKLVDTMEANPLCASSSNLSDMLTPREDAGGLSREYVLHIPSMS